MSPATAARVQRVLTWLMPSGYAEALLGDLVEECELRLQALPQASVVRWYWMQLASSMPALLWASLQREFSFITLATAVACFFVGAGVQVVLAMLSPMTTSAFLGTVILLFCSVVAMAVGGFVAALIRPGAAQLLAVLVFVAMFLMFVFNSGSVPLWREGSFLVLDSLAPIAGAASHRAVARSLLAARKTISRR